MISDYIIGFFAIKSEKYNVIKKFQNGIKDTPGSDSWFDNCNRLFLMAHEHSAIYKKLYDRNKQRAYELFLEFKKKKIPKKYNKDLFSPENLLKYFNEFCEMEDDLGGKEALIKEIKKLDLEDDVKLNTIKEVYNDYRLVLSTAAENSWAFGVFLMG